MCFVLLGVVLLCPGHCGVDDPVGVVVGPVVDGEAGDGSGGDAAAGVVEALGVLLGEGVAGSLAAGVGVVPGCWRAAWVIHHARR